MQEIMSCLLSLFASSDDAMEIHGTVQWLIAAYNDYRNRVKNNVIGYKAFMEENLVRLKMPIFLDKDATYNDLLQEMTDRDKVRHILENRKFTERHFSSGKFTEDEAAIMIASYNAIGTTEEKHIPLQAMPIADYPSEVFEGLTQVCNKHKLLSPDINAKDLHLLITSGKPSCKYMIPQFSRNRDLGLFLNILASAGALTENWSSIICTPGMLLTSKGIKMQAKNISAAMHRFDDYKYIYLDDRQRGIERDTLKVLSSLPSAVKNLRKRMP